MWSSCGHSAQRYARRPCRTTGPAGLSSRSPFSRRHARARRRSNMRRSPVRRRRSRRAQRREPRRPPPDRRCRRTGRSRLRSPATCTSRASCAASSQRIPQRAGADRADPAPRRHRGSEPRNRDHAARHTAGEGIHVSRAADGTHALAGGRRRRRDEANNHGIDFGPVGLLDTLAACAQRKGSGASARTTPTTPTHRSEQRCTAADRDRRRVASDRYALHRRLEPTDAQPGIASAKNIDRLAGGRHAPPARATLSLSFSIGGPKRTHCPTGDQRTIAAQLVQAGADVVVGSRSHQLEGAGRLGFALVDYGLGNFAFYTGTTSGVLTVTMTGRRVDRTLEPASIVGGVPNPVAGPAKQPAIDAWRRPAACHRPHPVRSKPAWRGETASSSSGMRHHR